MKLNGNENGNENGTDAYPIPIPIPIFVYSQSEASMKTSRIGGLMAIAGALALAGCATADLRPGIVRHETPKQIWQKFHGPDVHIRAIPRTTSVDRTINAMVSLGDSAYLLIGD